MQCNVKNNKNLLFYIVIICVCCPVFSLYAQSIDNIRTKYGKGNITFKFDLSTYWSVREKTDKRSGSVVIAPGNKFKVEIGDEQYISNGDKYWQFSKKAAQVTIENVKKIDVTALPSGILNQFLVKYKFISKGTANNITSFEWAADNGMASPYKAIKLWANDKNIITKLETTDNNDNVNTYFFNSVVFDQKIVAKTFEFQIPKNVQVLDNYE